MKTGNTECTGCTCFEDVDAVTGNTGAAAWATYLSGTNFVNVFSIDVDNNDNIYILGQYNSSSTVTLQNVSGTGQAPSLITLPAPTSSSSNACFLLKYNSDGIAQWATFLQGSVNAIANSLVVDSSANIYFCGQYNSASSFTLRNASGDTQALSSVSIPSTTQNAAFLCKYDTNGQAQWAIQLDGTGSTDEFRAVNVDSNSNIYIVGSYLSSGSVTLQNNNGSGGQTNSSITIPASTSSPSVVLAKYNSNGIAQWATNFTANGSAFTETGQVAIDSSNNIYLSGTFTNSSTATLQDASVNTQVASSITLPAVSSSASFILKYNSSGITQWATYIDGTGSDSAFGITSDDSNNIYIQTHYSSTVPVTLFNAYLTSQSPSAITLPITNIGFPFFAALVKYNSNGTVQWATHLPLANPKSLVFSKNNINATGNYSNATIQNVPSAAGNTQILSAITLPNTTTFNAYFIRYNLSGEVQWATNLPSFSIGDTIASDNAGSLYLGGNYNSSAFNVPSVSGNTQVASSVTLPGVTSTSNFGVLIKYV